MTFFGPKGFQTDLAAKARGAEIRETGQKRERGDLRDGTRGGGGRGKERGKREKGNRGGKKEGK